MPAHPIEAEQQRIDAELREAFAEPNILEALGFWLGVEPNEELLHVLKRQIAEADRHSESYVRSFRSVRRSACAAGLLVGVSLGRAASRLQERGEPLMPARDPEGEP